MFKKNKLSQVSLGKESVVLEVIGMLKPVKALKKYQLLLSANDYIYRKTHSANTLQFFSLSDSFQLCDQWAQNIPNEYDVIIGVPRAGLMFANIIACRLGRPLSTPDNFLKGEMWFSHDSPRPTDIRKVLIVEDSIGVGNQINNAYQRIKDAFPNLEVEKASLFVIPQSKDKVDYAFLVKPEPNIFEWNILTATWSWGDVVSTLEGVLCLDCPPYWNYKGERYMHFIKNTKPLLIPTYPLKAIITARPESVRALTEEWLTRNNVKYDHLIMRPDKTEPSWDNVLKMKIDVAKFAKPFWFWESNFEEAQEIHQQTGLPVLCTQTMTLFSKAKSD